MSQIVKNGTILKKMAEKSICFGCGAQRTPSGSFPAARLLAGAAEKLASNHLAA